MTFRIALAGNPNSGKTTLFNALTGSNQRVGNWPGVTVDKKQGVLKGHKDIIIEDLPGIYSLSPYTLEEVVSRQYLVGERPDLIINLVDASNLVRNLYLTSQLLELDIPVVIALNMMDIVESKGDKIDIDALSKKLGCPIVKTVASKENGVDELIKTAVKLKDTNQKPNFLEYDEETEKVLKEIEEKYSSKLDKDLSRYYAIKLFENDEESLKHLTIDSKDLAEVAKLRQEVEAKEEDDAESIITSARYERLEQISSQVLVKAKPKLSTTDKIDKIVTSRILGLPIFALVMFLVYFLSVYEKSPGTMGTDAVNGFFEDTLTPWAASTMEAMGINPVLHSLVTDGILAGVGAVLGFLPQMMVLFALLSILEDVGYMARVAFVMDRLFRRFGLSGKSFIPAMIATGCGVPGVQASRTIESDRDRKITIMTSTFMPCSAKLPVIALIVGAFFKEHAALVSFSFYMIGIASIVVSGIILKKFKELQADPAPFIMELPPYHAPRAKSVLTDVYNKSKAYAKRAGTIIFVSTIVIWLLSSFDFRLNLVEADTESSILASLGSLIAIIFRPIGFDSWQATVATITGFVAKENVVATMGVVLGLGADVTEESQELLMAFNHALATPVAGYSFLLFNMLCMPCFAAVGAIKTEMADNKWTALTIAYQMCYAYAVSLIFYNIANLIMYRIFNVWTVVAIIVLVGMIYLLVRKPQAQKSINYETGKVNG
ncbi:ferrous iron transport protein B [uncultured Anaerococcus sp.]|uniref:ferrous iron transport protein B n=1 Tax=uncultured Anaerococcus sp. TaxID=293428 RepID=UPI0026134203|nr:ferrous iron transport protein B [uncultured Anaerococcus sp.]